MADEVDFAKGASSRGNVYDTSASGLGLSPAYLANMSANASAGASAGGAGAGTSGAFGSRPAADDAVNQFYYAIDNGVLYFSDGSTWFQVPDAAIHTGEAAGGVLTGTYPSPSFAVDMATQAELNAEASARAAADAAVAAAAVNDGDAAGGVLSGTYPSPGFAVDMVTQTELNTALGLAVLEGDAAGGVLAGTYPSPTFAQDMATQTELNTEASTRAAADTAASAALAAATTFYYCAVRTQANYTNPTGVETSMATGGTVEEQDPSGLHNADTNRITIPADGVYHVFGHAIFFSGPNIDQGTFYVLLRDNSGTQQWGWALEANSTGSPMNVNIDFTSYFTSGTGINFYTNQYSGDDIVILAGSYFGVVSHKIITL